MTIVLAAIDDSAAALPVLRAGAMLARTLGAEPRALYVREGASTTATRIAGHVGIPVDVVEGDPVDCVVAAATPPQVAVLVVGARGHRGGHRPSGHVCRAAMTQLQKPVLVVPPEARVLDSARVERALVPLEGTTESSEAIAPAMHALERAGVDVTVVHVFGAQTAPRFRDQSAHADESWGAEFLARWWRHPRAGLRLRSGDVTASILDVAATEAADLIVLGWSQHMGDDRAKVVREVLGRSEIPVLLVPVGA
jgi:nucleotide-binding universal stress UspA family protein